MNKLLEQTALSLRSPVNYKTDPELKAWIYQQLAQLEPFVVPNSHIGVKVQREGADGVALPDGDFIVTLSAEMPDGNSPKVHAVATNENVFSAVAHAREILTDALLENENVPGPVVEAPRTNLH